MSFKTDLGAADRERYAQQGIGSAPGIIVNVNKEVIYPQELADSNNHAEDVPPPVFSDEHVYDAEKTFAFMAERYSNVIHHLEDVLRYVNMDAVLRIEARYTGTLLCSRSLYREKCKESILLPNNTYLSYEKFMRAFDDILRDDFKPTVEGNYYSSYDYVCFGIRSGFWPFWRYNISPKKAARIFNKLTRKLQK